MKSKKHVVVLATVLVSSVAFVQPANADFQKIDEIHLSTSTSHHGIAFDGSNWHIADPWDDIFNTYDRNFVFLRTRRVAGVGDMRGLTFDKNSGNLFVGDHDTNIVREVTLDGVEIQQFQVSHHVNALAYDAVTDTIWTAAYTGVIERRTRTGSLISSFDRGEQWTGLAFDEFNNTLIALEDGDTFYEFQTDGTLIARIIPTDQLPYNGLGAAYDAATGTLYATSQSPGIVTVFQDPARIPEPATVVLLGLGGVALVCRRR